LIVVHVQPTSMPGDHDADTGRATYANSRVVVLVSDGDKRCIAANAVPGPPGDHGRHHPRPSAAAAGLSAAMTSDRRLSIIDPFA
jgi:hypothetical protein